MGARTDAARTEVLAAREGLENEVVRLEAAGRAAFDIRTRLRNSPLKVGGAAAGAAFLLLGGPRRILGRTRRAIFGAPAGMPRSMLPEEVEAVLRKLGPDGDRVRETLEREFARFLKDRTPKVREGDLVGLAGGLIGNALRPASVRAGREFAERLFDPDGPSFADGLRKARARMTAAAGKANPKA
ncbi:MAG: hypothetical protein HYX54_07820 [Chloroflexi bacterium]|nr:hypothetical protein [Chloroflexota bacterium]